MVWDRIHRVHAKEIGKGKKLNLISSLKTFSDEDFSGGPFTCKNSHNEPVLYGLTSYGIWGCGSEGMPDFYTNVRLYTKLP